MAKVVEHLPSKCETLSSNLIATKKKKKVYLFSVLVSPFSPPALLIIVASVLTSIVSYLNQYDRAVLLQSALCNENEDSQTVILFIHSLKTPLEEMSQ
jgi:hypothetical protein